MKVFLDLNVILDYLAEREIFMEDTRELFAILSQNNFSVFYSGIDLGTLDFLLEKYNYTKAERIQKLNWLYDTFRIVFFNHRIVASALHSEFSDFEDALQYYSATENNCDFIISRNATDFSRSAIPVYTTKGFLDLLRENSK